MAEATLRAESACATSSTSRRALLGALAAAPVAVAAIALPATAAPNEQAPREGERNLYKVGLEKGQEFTLYHVARAWIDRWKACGGNFGPRLNTQGEIVGFVRGIPEPDFWTPTDEGNPKLAPHIWLTEMDHQIGAVKVLDAMLAMIPGLRDTVREIETVNILVAYGREG